MGILVLPEQPNKMYATKEELKNKVDKVGGKGLSTNDFTNEYKVKLDGLKNSDVDKSYVDTKLGEKANKVHTHEDLTRLISALTERVTALENAQAQ